MMLDLHQWASDMFVDKYWLIVIDHNDASSAVILMLLNKDFV